MLSDLIVVANDIFLEILCQLGYMQGDLLMKTGRI